MSYYKDPKQANKIIKISLIPQIRDHLLNPFHPRSNPQTKQPTTPYFLTFLQTSANPFTTKKTRIPPTAPAKNSPTIAGNPSKA